MTFISKMV